MGWGPLLGKATGCLGVGAELGGGGLSAAGWLSHTPLPMISLLAVPRRHFCFFYFKLLSFVFLARLIAVVSTVSTCLVCNSSIVAPCPPIPAARFAFSLCFIRFVFLVHGCCIW